MKLTILHSWMWERNYKITSNMNCGLLGNMQIFLSTSHPVTHLKNTITYNNRHRSLVSFSMSRVK